jgi:hypothetical protein
MIGNQVEIEIVMSVVCFWFGIVLFVWIFLLNCCLFVTFLGELVEISN